MKGIKLICGEQSQSFPFMQAQGLLQIQGEMNRVSVIKRKGWELPEDSPYEFKDNGLIKRTNKGNSKVKTVVPRDKKGSKASEQA